MTFNSSEDEDMDERKLPAVGSLQELERSAKHCFAATKACNERAHIAMERKGLLLQPYEQLTCITQVLNSIIPLSSNFYKFNGTDGMEKVEKQLMRSQKVRAGLLEMVNHSITLVDLFSFYTEEVFSKTDVGITKTIQLLMSK